MLGFRRFGFVPALAAAIVAVAMLAGCGAGTVTQDPTRLAGDWMATAIRSGSGGSAVLATGPAPTARFADGTVSGSGGVNTYRSAYHTTGPDAITITLGAVTKTAGPAAIMDQENAYLSAVADARRYRMSGDSLELLDADGATILRYVRAAPVTLANHVWTCDAYNNGKQAVVSLSESSTITLRFGGDGRLSGSSGVNQYATSYSAQGASLTIDAIMATTRMSGPSELMDQETAYLHALQLTARYEISGDRLVLWGDGEMGRVASYHLTQP